MKIWNNEKAAAIEAVIAASKLCENVRQRLNAGDHKEKEDRSPVTIADYGSQAVILSHLAKAFPNDPAVAEEDAAELTGATDLRQRIITEVQTIDPDATEHSVITAIDRGNYGGIEGRFWTLDPIDGTKGFLRQDQYAVALALIENGEVVLSVLGCPALPHNLDLPHGGAGCLLVSQLHHGTEIYDMQGHMLSGAVVDDNFNPALSTICESVESGHSKHDWAAAIAEKLGVKTQSIRMDSQCKYAAVARGDASIYLRLPTRPGYQEKIWDHAAGMLAVVEAGGRVTDMNGAPLDFAKGQTLSANSGVVASNLHVHDAVLQAIAETKNEYLPR
ncbi:3'(2'),5'-bisphosphate nucleotidase [Cerasicoccus arenae]|uniref:3'(2'),5'-bisphosphate nucleotidase n=1 Tax=Cerasicoccus arenae TaxID=424488 RepID=A0A8J3DDT4_9BACT|nr:3'(2'),5'-bisphosphate nucleotidase [Cerasicoccus arenae]MBK1858930.1 3'(2'),5'-bisphosphate nucleotidase [Cerasicoccus arenae]GHC08273.1 3'(2'),5'-bisphosphate nucleotidase [Cerasicoccus arenae]